MEISESNTRHLRTLEVARCRQGYETSMRSVLHHEGIELVAVGVAEIGGIELRAAVAGRALVGGAERERELVDAIDLLLVLGGERRHYAIARRHRLAVMGQADAEASAL